MDALAYDLKQLCRANGDGSRATQANRHQICQLLARQLAEGGYAMQSAHALKPKHITHLIGRWEREGVSTGTMKNRLAAIRWWAAKVRKQGILPRTNLDVGIGDRENRAARAMKLDRDKLAAIPCPYVRASLELQAAFGLRREEAIKFTPSRDMRPDCIVLKASTTKGGKGRVIPITHPRQREALALAARVAGDGSLIPTGRQYVEQLKTYENQTLRAGLRNNHGLRHWWAQWRYEQLAAARGLHAVCPARGGPDPKSLDTRARAIDSSVRLTLSRELGHERIEITKVYLGG